MKYTEAILLGKDYIKLFKSLQNDKQSASGRTAEPFPKAEESLRGGKTYSLLWIPLKVHERQLYGFTSTLQLAQGASHESGEFTSVPGTSGNHVRLANISALVPGTLACAACYVIREVTQHEPPKRTAMWKHKVVSVALLERAIGVAG